MIHRTAHFFVMSDKLDEAIELIKNFTNAVNENEDDCILYRSLQSGKNELEFLHYMIFRDQEAEDHHRATPHVKEFVDNLYPILEKKPVFTSYNLIID